MDEEAETIARLGDHKIREISRTVPALALLGFFVLGWCLYKRLK